MLDAYLQRTRLLMQDQNFVIFNEEDLINFINMARGQIAGQSECVRVLAPLNVSGGTQQYNFSSIALSTTGVQGVLHVRQINYTVASGQKPLHVRSWPYFQQYYLGQPVPTASEPNTWSQYGQGTLGSLYVNLLDADYVLTCDTVCYPANMTTDSSTEVIPYEWTDAVPYFAAYVAAQSVGDMDKAEKWSAEYEKFVARGRGYATPAVLPHSYAQGPDMVRDNRLGLQAQRGQQ